MYIITTGQIRFLDEVSPELIEKCLAVLDGDDVMFLEVFNELDLNDVQGFVGQELNEIARLAEEDGVRIDPNLTRLTFNGDYDGGYLYEDGVFNSYDQEDYILRSADTDVLLAELTRRGVFGAGEPA